MAASFSPMDVAQLKQMWMPFVATDARNWVMDHIFAGRILSGQFEAAVPPGYMWTAQPVRLTDDMMRLDIQMDGVSLATFGELPPITNAAGQHFARRFDFWRRPRQWRGEGAVGHCQVDAGAFAISNLAARPADGVIELELSGLRPRPGTDRRCRSIEGTGNRTS